jgi:alpha,alpha-trehalase
MLERALEVDPSLLEIGLEAAEKEYAWWMKNRLVKVLGDDGNYHHLNVFSVIENSPRLESFKEDLHVFKSVFEENILYKSNTQQGAKDLISERLYSNLKSAAESGYDFSSRWLTNDKELSSTSILDQIPTDLNAVIFKVENILSKLFEQKGDLRKAYMYKEKALVREQAINTILWNKEKQVWMDYNFILKKFQDRVFYASNLTPLVYGVKSPVSEYKILKMYQKELFFYIGGIPASGEGVPEIEQWDFPNSWPPHQHMMAEMLTKMNEPQLALNVAQRYYRSVVNGYKIRKDFDEKYLCTKEGGQGDGGEYLPQKGFGWTNGVFLSFVNQFGEKLSQTKLTYEEISDILNERLNINNMNAKEEEILTIIKQEEILATIKEENVVNNNISEISPFIDNTVVQNVMFVSE